MKLNYFKESLSVVGRLMATVLLLVSAVTFIWHGAFLSNTSAMAAPNVNLIAASGTGDKIQGKASEDAGRTKNFVRDTANKVERTAKRTPVESIRQRTMAALLSAKPREMPPALRSEQKKIPPGLKVRSTKRRMRFSVPLRASRMHLTKEQNVTFSTAYF